MLATLFSCLTLLYWWPAFFGESIVKDFADWMGIGVFILTSMLISGVTEIMRRSRARTGQVQEVLQRTNAELQAARDTLEDQVHKRTVQLEEAKAGLEKELIERSQAEQGLKESTARLERSQAIAHLGSWELDVVNNVLTWSDEVYRIFGLQPQEFEATYEAFLEAVHPEDRKAVDDAYSGSLRENRDSYEIEHRVVRKSTGEIRHVHERCTHVRDESGNIIRSIGMVHDITERKQASNRIKRQNATLEGVNRILEAGLLSATEEELGKTCLKVVEEITGSAFAFIGEIGADGNMHDLAVSDPGWEACAMEDKTGHRRITGNFPVHGIYGRVLVDGTSLIANDPSSHPDRIGVPEGHPILKSFLGVPLMRYGKTTGMIAVANRDGGYSEVEKETLESLAPAVVEALGRKRAEDALHKAHDELEARVKERTAELEKAKDAVTAERQRLFDILDTMPEMVCLLTPDHHYAFVNRSFRDKFGEHEGRHCFDLVFDNKQPCEFCEAYTVLETGKPHHWEVETSDGAVIEVHNYPFEDVDGSPLILEIDIDVTEQKRAQEALRIERQRLYDVLETLPVYVCLLDSDYRMPFANRYFREAFGESHGRRCHDFLFSLQVPCETCETYKVMKTRAPHHWYWTGPNGCDYDIYDFPFYDRDGSLLILEMGIDITEMRRAQNERENLITELEARNAELERFTYSVSHDLKSPLITIRTFLGFVAESIAKGNTQDLKSDLDRIDNAAKKMGKLLDEILELSRVGRMFNPPSEAPMAEVASEALELLSGTIAQYDVQIEIAPDLPILYGDRPRLREVFQNLIENSLKFMGDQPHPRIEIGAKADCKETVLFVRDNGMGIDPRYSDKVFGLFNKLDQKSEGTGIGLALVKRIVEVHGGRIWLESDGPGQGSTFYFTIPRPEVVG